MMAGRRYGWRPSEQHRMIGFSQAKFRLVLKIATAAVNSQGINVQSAGNEASLPSVFNRVRAGYRAPIFARG
jgi:hypothetical protein